MPASTRSTDAPLRASSPWPFVPLRNLRDLRLTVQAGIGRNVKERATERTLQQLGALPGAAVQPADQLVELRSDLEQGEAAARDNALLDRRPGGIDRILDQLGAALLLDRRGTAREDHRRAAGQLCDPFLEFVPLDIFGCGIVLAHDLFAARGDLLLIAPSGRDQRFRGGDAYLARGAEVVQFRLFELPAEIDRNDAASGSNRDILEHRLAPMAEFRRMDRGNPEVGSSPDAPAIA